VREAASVVDQPVFRKENVRFPAEGGIELSAWLFVPERRTARLPAITMAHGYAGTKYHGIEPVAEASAQAGFVVLLHIAASATAAANRGPT
jgi:cephalosporin-C deacetylase-like acetyl esterase